jgi:anti-sigma factor RsiW
MDADSPFEGDVPRDGDEPGYEWLDEWLCEYVDGTMDPSLEAVFEQYVEANPELKAHVQRLKETRDLLCRCGLPDDPPSDVEDEVCREVECDMRRPARSAEEPVRAPLARAGVVSAVTAALVIGFLVGAMVVRPVSPAITSHDGAADPGAAEADAAPSTERPVRAFEQSPSDRLLRPSATPLSAADTAQSAVPITPLGTP